MRRGFTLVEISIVLVIIGLIVGGVMFGRELIKAAEMRQAVSDIDKLKVSIATFKLKYNCLPGDCSTATNFFTGVANGNGNGTYGENDEGNINIWLHLQGANLLFYGPYSTSAITGPDPGVNAPLIPWMFKNAILEPGNRDDGMVMHLRQGNICGNPTWNGCEGFQTDIIFNWLETNYIVLGVYGIDTATLHRYSVDSRFGMLSDTLQTLDMKIDDGMPMAGAMRTYYTASSRCTSGASTTQPYQSGSTAACLAYIKLGM